MDYQIKHILVDEFQDTSSTQLNLIKGLVDNWNPDTDRTLFLVGDAMQSLYSFRSANVGLFLNSQKHPVGPIHCQPLTLSTNFRSDRVIIDWVNSIFSESFPKEPEITRGAVPYSSSTAFKFSSERATVDFTGFTGGESDQEEAKHIAKRCKEIVVRENSETIAIMVRSRNHLKYIIPELQVQGLSWDAQEIVKLSRKMCVVDLMSLTRALLSPADRIAWLAILRAPFCGLGLRDILLISNSNSNKSYSGGILLEQLTHILESPAAQGLSDYGSKALARIVPILSGAWSNRRRHNLRALVESTWYALGGPATLSDELERSDVRRFFDLLESYQESASIKDWKQFELAADKLFASPSYANDVAEYSSNKIQIMTIHKSKGLEFDHVFLPGLANQSVSDKKSLMQWQVSINEENQESLLIAPLGAHDDDEDPVYKYLRYEQSLRSRLEKTRVMYVAATRAIKGLYLYAKLKSRENGDMIPPSKSSLLSTIWEPIERLILSGKYEIIETDDPHSVASMERIRPSLKHIRRLPAEFIAVKPSINSLMTTDSARAGYKSESQSIEDVSIRASQLGTLFHRTLKQLANEGLDAWPLSRRQQIPLAWVSQLREVGLIATDPEITELKKALESTLNDRNGQWILKDHAKSASEKSITYIKSDGSFGTSIIDRTFVSNGVRWIIDYKLSKPNNDESFADFENRQLDLYTAQLSHYASLYGQISTEPVKCALYFPKLGSFVEVSIN
jgi:ATP-dependent exoDNAse (exonuclease V) beta subunit